MLAKVGFAFPSLVDLLHEIAVSLGPRFEGVEDLLKRRAFFELMVPTAHH